MADGMLEHEMVEIKGSDTERVFECISCGVQIGSGDNWTVLDDIPCRRQF